MLDLVTQAMGTHCKINARCQKASRCNEETERRDGRSVGEERRKGGRTGEKQKGEGK